MLRTLPAPLAALLALLLIGSAPQTAQAQVRFDGIEATAGFFTWSGRDFRDVDGGARYQGGPMVRIGERWQVGVEGFYGEGELQLQTNPVFLDEYGVNGVVRRAFGDLRSAHFFALLRGGWTRLTSEIRSQATGEVTTGLSQDGWSLGPEIGVGFNPSPYIDVVWGVGVNYESFSECEVFGPDDFTTGQPCSGIRWGVRVGLALGRRN